ncbi:MAG TPA: hypothetical protein VFB84_20665 [Micromonosporaceae bacterium]|nr:hypothetical protein [Micromonosporaceae bacterium]
MIQPFSQNVNVGKINAVQVGFGNGSTFMVGDHLSTVSAAPTPTLGVVTALEEEFVAMKALLDSPAPGTAADDRGCYEIGTVPSADPDEPHLVVLTLLGETGTHAAASSCAHLARSFGSVNCVLMVGVAAGVPRPDTPRRHVRLGDLVVASWGVVDYDHVVELIQGRTLRQHFPLPSPLLASRAKILRAEERSGRRPWRRWLDEGAQNLPGYERPPTETDAVFAGKGGRLTAHPDTTQTGHEPGWPKVHYGLIGSADRSLRNAVVRDDIAVPHDLLAIEMEGTGIGRSAFSSGLEWFVVRGISDYGDDRTNLVWRNYASLAAAAYTRALLQQCPPIAPRGGHTRQTGSTRS